MNIEYHVYPELQIRMKRHCSFPVLICVLNLLFSASCAAPGRVEQLSPEEAAAKLPAPIKGKFAEIQGAKIFYSYTQPRGDGAHNRAGLKADELPPIILIHGLGASAFSFRRNIPELARDTRVIAMDLKGFGLSKEYSNKDLSFHAEAELVVALMNSLQIPRAILVGHSLGGSIAALVAAQYPDRIDRLVLIDSATLYITRPWVTRLLHGRLLSHLAYQVGGPDRKRVRQLLLKSYADKSKVTETDVDSYVFPFHVKNSGESLRLFLTTTNPNKNALFAHIQSPTLILWGAEDTFIDPSVRDFLHQQIRNSKVVVIKGAGHAVQEEKPEEVNREIIDFIKNGR